MRITQQVIDGIGMTSKRTRSRLITRLREKGITDERVLAAMAEVPRHLFVDEALASRAYEDTALPIGYGQTISQPYIVALMTQTVLANNGSPNKVLEIGTGSGYQAALLSRLVGEVCTVERVFELRQKVAPLFDALGYHNIRTHLADGSHGWKPFAPFDAIIVTAAPEQVPESLLEQLAVGGRMVVPVGSQGGAQALLAIDRGIDGFSQTVIEKVNFVPFLTGQIR